MGPSRDLHSEAIPDENRTAFRVLRFVATQSGLHHTDETRYDSSRLIC